MSETVSSAQKKKRFRSPPYPAFALERAVGRTKELHKHAQHHEVGVSTLQEAWGMKSAEGQVWRTAAALIQYGLVEDSGTGKLRKFKVTDAGRRIVLDADPSSEKRKQAMKATALCPMIHQELWENYGLASGVSDSVLRTYLTVDRVEKKESPYSETAANEVIEIYRSTLDYAGLSDSDKVASLEGGEVDKGKTPKSEDSNTVEVQVGDFVQWASNGQDMFKVPRQVTWIADDLSCVGVFGSPSGVPMSEITVVEAPGKGGMQDPNPAKEDSASGRSDRAHDISAYLVGNRLQISAEVDAAGIKKLKDILDKYEEILKLLN
ncbi:MAG: hypothetical protein OEN23_09095 [Paracoccaceae bacterium]|nr:hypothetical protein [Paracoccaceae bacterium]